MDKAKISFMDDGGKGFFFCGYSSSVCEKCRLGKTAEKSFTVFLRAFAIYIFIFSVVQKKVVMMKNSTQINWAYVGTDGGSRIDVKSGSMRENCHEIVTSSLFQLKFGASCSTSSLKMQLLSSFFFFYPFLFMKSNMSHGIFFNIGHRKKAWKHLFCVST